MPMIKLISVAALLLLANPAFAADPEAKPPTPTRGVMRYDANKDGWVDKAEWNAGQEARFKELDTNKDGKLSKAEFMVQAERNFARCDLDKDGRINTAECRQALRRPSATPVR